MTPPFSLGVEGLTCVVIQYFQYIGKVIEIDASDPIVTPVDLPWPGFNDHLIVLGMCV